MIGSHFLSFSFVFDGSVNSEKCPIGLGGLWGAQQKMEVKTMIISRKRFNEAIREAEERVYREMMDEQNVRRASERNDRRFAEVQQRIHRLEKKVFDEEKGFEDETFFGVTPKF